MKRVEDRDSKQQVGGGSSLRDYRMEGGREGGRERGRPGHGAAQTGTERESVATEARTLH